MIVQPDNLPDDQIEVWQQAVESFQRAYRMQLQGDLANAIHDYKLSIRLFPTAEAYTFLGWVFAHLALYDEAITACKLAIETDPEFGNPYNDIGAYLTRPRPRRRGDFLARTGDCRPALRCTRLRLLQPWPRL
jgi:tetratricopeptide (TPR) repeat protein